MTEYDNTNRGVLFNNADRKDTPNHPDYAGNINVDGAEYWINGWIKTSKAGKKFLSLSVKPKQQQAPPTDRPLRDEMDDEIPF